MPHRSSGGREYGYVAFVLPHCLSGYEQINSPITKMYVVTNLSMQSQIWSVCLSLIDCRYTVTSLRWERLRPPEGRLLRLPGLAAVLLCGRNEKHQRPQWQNHVVQCEWGEIMAGCP